MVSKEDIINIALDELGSDMILLAEPETAGARTLGARFATTLDAVLRAHPWNCAMARALVAADAETPAFDWGYQYTLPAEPFCLRAWRVNEDHRGRGKKYTVEGRKLLTNEAGPIRLRYIKRVSDLSELDSLTVQAFALRLASGSAYRITQSRTLAKDLWDRYVAILREARSIDAQEGTPEEVESDSWLDARA